MLLFRSEEHLERWLRDPAHPRGETLTPAAQWELARSWFEGRDAPSWAKRTPSEAEEVFRSVGLTSGFWSVT
jgi:hypothetical protein